MNSVQTLDAADLESIALALGRLPTWFPETAAKIERLRAALGRDSVGDAGLDVERLARAIKRITEGTPGWLAGVDQINSASDVTGLAHGIAAEYADDPVKEEK